MWAAVSLINKVAAAVTPGVKITIIHIWQFQLRRTKACLALWFQLHEKCFEEKETTEETFIPQPASCTRHNKQPLFNEHLVLFHF